jgi:hypothetical protein
VGALAFIGGLVQPAVDMVDDLHLSGEEKGQLQNELARIENDFTSRFLDLERDLTLAQTEVIKAEATQGSWLAQNWRPITMLTFVGLLVWTWLTKEGITPELQAELMEIVKWTMGVYVGGRSIEKVVGKRRA